MNTIAFTVTLEFDDDKPPFTRKNMDEIQKLVKDHMNDIYVQLPSEEYKYEYDEYDPKIEVDFERSDSC